MIRAFHDVAILGPFGGMESVNYDRRDIFSKDGSPEATGISIKLVTHHNRIILQLILRKLNKNI